MSEYLIQGQTLTGIADAIRAQLGTEQQYTPESMAAAIGSIQSGGAGAEDSIVTREIAGTYVNDRVSQVGDNVFKSCTLVTNIRFDSVVSVGNASFSGCTGIVTAYFPKAQTISSQAFLSNGNAMTYYFGNLKSISSQAFTNFSLKSGHGENAAIIIDSDAVCTLADANALQNFRGTVYVKDNLVEQYKVATNWATYAAQIKGRAEIPAEVQEWLDQQGGASA